MTDASWDPGLLGQSGEAPVSEGPTTGWTGLLEVGAIDLEGANKEGNSLPL